MTNKLSAYELLSSLIPGILLLAWIPVCFPTMPQLFSGTGFPSAFVVIALTALALFLGQLVHALASLIEPLIFKTWGGQPSDKALKTGLRKLFPQDSAERIKARLLQAVGEGTSDHSLFLYAMQRAEADELGRARAVNTLYAYHRSLLVVTLLATAMLLVSMCCGAIALWTTSQKVSAGILIVLLVLLIWYRAWQRAAYYVREVLLTAERVLDDRKPAKE